MRRCARVDVARIQNAARNAMEWFEVVGSRYADTLEPEQFMYSLLTRSQRISHENLRLRDKAWLEGYERWFAARAGVDVDPDGPPVPPMFTPFAIRGVTLAEPHRRLADGDVFGDATACSDDFHLVHLGARAMGGAALVFARDDLRLARRAHHAGLPRPVERRAGGGLEAASSISSTPAARQSSACSSAMPAARARRGSRGKASTSRSTRATGR